MKGVSSIHNFGVPHGRLCQLLCTVNLGEVQQVRSPPDESHVQRLDHIYDSGRQILPARSQVRCSSSGLTAVAQARGIKSKPRRFLRTARLQVIPPGCHHFGVQLEEEFNHKCTWSDSTASTPLRAHRGFSCSSPLVSLGRASDFKQASATDR